MTVADQDVDEMFRRLAARGTVEVSAYYSEVLLRWWPHGQKGNFLCAKTCREATLSEALVVMLDATKPRYDVPLRWVVEERLNEWWRVFGVLTGQAA